MGVWHALTRGEQHGPLPALLLALTVATGLVVALAGAYFGGRLGRAHTHRGRNSTARRLAVPDLSTTVLTTTISGLASEIRRQGLVAASRRGLAVVTMFLGALIGAVLVQHTDPAWALAAATVLIGLVATVSALHSRGSAPWHAVRS